MIKPVNGACQNTSHLHLRPRVSSIGATSMGRTLRCSNCWALYFSGLNMMCVKSDQATTEETNDVKYYT